MLIDIVRPTKWVCRMFFFPEKSKMAAKIEYFWRFFTLGRVLCSYESFFFFANVEQHYKIYKQCMADVSVLREIQDGCQKGLIFVFFPFRKCFTAIWEPIFTIEVHQYDKTYKTNSSDIFCFSKKSRWRPKCPLFGSFSHFWGFSFHLGAFWCNSD